MSDVARRAGVSTATVSRALSGPASSVRGETRDRVLRAVEEIGYVPDRLARNLRRRSAQIFALVVSDIGNPFFTAVARGFEDGARAADHSVIIADTDEIPAVESRRLLELVAEGVAGIVLASTGTTSEGLEQAVRARIPVVALDRRIDAGFDTVACDGARGAAEAVGALIAAGRRRIALIGGPEAISSMADRRDGYERALREHGIAVDPELVVHGDMREASGHDATAALLASARPPGAVFVANNLMAMGALRAIFASGRRIPDDLAIACFDDFAASELIPPGIAAVAQPTYRLGAGAAELLVRRIAEPGAPVREIVLPGRLIERPSIGLARAA
ncbi:MAG: LacI family DNA-binding transcriptional regulator [Actinobacteria bacterium]|nr:LacI family DNA-binding transcriptional regulator [Actinomycetota bacterium]